MTSTPQHEIAWRALAQAYIRTRDALEVAFKVNDLPGLVVFEALRALERGGNTLTAKALEQMLEMPQYRVSRLLDRMEKDGLIKRASHKTDRRAKLIEVTEHGRATLTGMVKVHKDALAAFLRPRAKPGQLDRMADLLSLLDKDAD